MTQCPHASRDNPEFTAKAQLRFPAMPSRIQALPADSRGFPVPYFASWIDGEPNFVAVEPDRAVHCWKANRCWLCGQPLGAYKVFVIDPMCIVNRTSAEPGCHLDCARFAATACPFLVQPRMKRNDKEAERLGGREAPGIMLRRNPGVTALWSGKRPSLFAVQGGYLFDIGDPAGPVEWYCEGRAATRAEVVASLETGMPELMARASAVKRPDAAIRQLEQQFEAALVHLPVF